MNETLEAEREFLLRSLDDLEAEHDAGNVDDETYRTLHDDYTARAVKNIKTMTGLDVEPAPNRFRVTQSMGDVLAYSGAMRRLAVELSKIASDLRLLSMGPRAGRSEISLPAVQPVGMNELRSVALGSMATLRSKLAEKIASCSEQLMSEFTSWAVVVT